MKTQYMYVSFFRSAIILLLFSATVNAQQEDKKTIKDTLIFKQKYGLRLGADIGKLTRTFLDDNYKGLELRC